LLGEWPRRCCEIVPFDVCSGNLLSKKTVFDRMVDMLHKLAMDALRDRRRSMVCINQQYGNVWLFLLNRDHAPSAAVSAAPKGLAAAVARDVPLKRRQFIDKRTC
jgi:hypothetical protein